MNSSSEKKAIKTISAQGGVINTQTAIRMGIQPRTLYGLRDRGELIRLSRGLYRISSLPEISNPDLVTVALRYPKAVLCLVSALSFHGLTTQIPHMVHIALEKGAEQPRLEYPPLAVYRFSRASYSPGIESHSVDGIQIPVYSREKTLVDCFKFRNAVGMDVFLEALKIYRQDGNFKFNDLLEYASVCRVAKGIKPYLEAVL